MSLPFMELSSPLSWDTGSAVARIHSARRMSGLLKPSNSSKIFRKTSTYIRPAFLVGILLFFSGLSFGVRFWRGAYEVFSSRMHMLKIKVCDVGYEVLSEHN